MKIGDIVLVKALIRPEYTIDNYRKLVREEFDSPKEMIYTGYTFRQEGIYVGGGRPHYNPFGLEDYYEPPYLSVEKTVKVLRVKEHERCNDRFAFIEDVLK
jgi:hypothetical protein